MKQEIFSSGNQCLQDSFFLVSSFLFPFFFFFLIMPWSLEYFLLSSDDFLTLVGSVRVSLSDLLIENVGLQIEAIFCSGVYLPEIIKHEGLNLQVFYLSSLTNQHKLLLLKYPSVWVLHSMYELTCWRLALLLQHLAQAVGSAWPFPASMLTSSQTHISVLQPDYSITSPSLSLVCL